MMHITVPTLFDLGETETGNGTETATGFVTDLGFNRNCTGTALELNKLALN